MREFDLDSSSFVSGEQAFLLPEAKTDVAWRDRDTLLEHIVVAAKDISHADGGTLYLLSEEGDVLEYVIMRTDSVGLAFGGATKKKPPFPVLQLYDAHTGDPNLRTQVIRAVIRKEAINIADAYQSDEFDFIGTRKFDLEYGFRTRSVITIPMINHRGEAIGCVQLINAKDPVTGASIGFSDEMVTIISSLASQAAVIVDKETLITEQKTLLESFIKMMAAAIDEPFAARAWLPWALIAPQMIIILVFFFWPAGQALYQSVLQQDAFGTTAAEFVGLDNFRQLFADETYLASFKTTAVFSLLVASLGLVIALLLAVMANRVIRGAAVYKTLLIWPYGVAPVVAGVLWLMMFASPYGVVAFALQKMGLPWDHLLNANHAMALIVMAAVWKQISYNFLFFLAGLQSIPHSLIEAATIDGATPWKRFWSIVFPLLSPTTFFLLVINVVYAFFDTFAIVDAATHGGPGKDTAILVYKVYYDGFKAQDMGGSAAQSVVLMVIVIALTIAQFKFVEKKVNY
mgnify:CR=1 FL=1